MPAKPGDLEYSVGSCGVLLAHASVLMLTISARSARVRNVTRVRSDRKRSYDHSNTRPPAVDDVRLIASRGAPTATPSAAAALSAASATSRCSTTSSGETP